MNFFKFLLFFLPIFLISEASAGENFISAAPNAKQIVPFNQLIEHSFTKNYKEYNELAQKNNVGFYLGSKASSLNQVNPSLNSYNLIHQAFLASRLDSARMVISTDAYAKYEVAYISKNQLTISEVMSLLKKCHAPIIYLDFKNEWVLASTNFSIANEPFLLTGANQFVLNNYVQEFDLFPPASLDLQLIRLGDTAIFNKKTLNVDSLTEFKTCHKVIDFSKINSIFDNKFEKAPFVDQQLLDFNTKIIYYRASVHAEVTSHNLNNFQVDDSILTKKFKSGRDIATLRTSQPILQFNSVTTALNKFFKR